MARGRISISKAVILVCVLSFNLSIFSLVFAEEFRYDSHGKRDPFVPLNSTEDVDLNFSHGELRLEGVVVDLNGESYAIVNGEIVREGQVFQGFTLKSVSANKVNFEKDGEGFEIILQKDDLNH